MSGCGVEVCSRLTGVVDSAGSAGSAGPGGSEHLPCFPPQQFLFVCRWNMKKGRYSSHSREGGKVTPDYFRIIWLQVDIDDKTSTEHHWL
jgi:hypothetical protein